MSSTQNIQHISIPKRFEPVLEVFYKMVSDDDDFKQYVRQAAEAQIKEVSTRGNLKRSIKQERRLMKSKSTMAKFLIERYLKLKKARVESSCGRNS